MARALWIVTAMVLLAGCGKGKSTDPKGDIVAETLKHIEQMEPAVARLGKLSEVTAATEVMATVRLAARDLSQWQREYRALRAKMLLRNVSREQHGDLNRHYQAAVEDVRLKLEQTERRITRRSDVHLFNADLLRLRQIVRDL